MASSANACESIATASWRSPPPRALGSTLTHPQITTDYSEALLEFITPTETDVADTLADLERIHRFASSKLDGEYLWSHRCPASCRTRRASRSPAMAAR